MPQKVGSKWRWGNVERGSKKELAQTVYGIWKKNGSKGDFGDFWRKGKAEESIDTSKMLDFKVNAKIQEAYAKIHRSGRVNEDETSWYHPNVWWTHGLADKDTWKEGLKGGGRALTDVANAFGKMGTGALNLVGAKDTAKRLDDKLDKWVDDTKHGTFGSDYGMDFDSTSDTGGKVAGAAFTSAALGGAVKGLGMLGKAGSAASAAEKVGKVAKTTSDIVDKGSKLKNIAMTAKDFGVKGLKGYGWHRVGDDVGDVLDATGHEKAAKVARFAGDAIGIKSMLSPTGVAGDTMSKILFGVPGGVGLSYAAGDSAEAMKNAGMIDDETAKKIQTAGDYAGFGVVGKPMWDAAGELVFEPIGKKVGEKLAQNGNAENLQDGGDEDVESAAEDDDMLYCTAEEGCTFRAPNQQAMNQHYMSAHGVAEEDLPDDD